MRLGLMIVVALAIAGCGQAGQSRSDASSRDARAAADAPVIDAAADAALDALPDVREAGGEAAPPAMCPGTPPVSGSACAGQDCFYEDCAGRGRTIALCHPEGTFDVQTTACTATTCIGAVRLTCAASDICKDASCAPNPCGTGPITCACACAGACTVAGGSGGITVTCAPSVDAGGADGAGARDAAADGPAPSVSQNPPVPTGWGLIPPSEITADMTDWAVMILDDPVTYPMFSTAMRTFGVVTVLARVEWIPPDFSNASVHRGVTLYEPL